MQQTDTNDEALQPGSTATPFSTFIWAVVSGDVATAEAQLADDVEWDLMPYDHMLKGKEEVIPWLKAGGLSRKEPVVISNLATRERGVFELWNIGTLTEDVVEFGKQQGGRFRETRAVSLAGATKWPSASCITSMRRAR